MSEDFLENPRISLVQCHKDDTWKLTQIPICPWCNKDFR